MTVTVCRLPYKRDTKIDIMATQQGSKEEAVTMDLNEWLKTQTFFYLQSISASLHQIY
jgi:hypothetical protein